MTPSPSDVRAWFPALDSGFAFLENAGGSQVPGVVADAMRDYMLTSYVQLGAGYAHARRADEVVAEAHAFAETLVGADGIGRVVLGPSTTALTHLLANAYADTLRPGDEVVIAETNHEANAGPWEKLARRGATVRLWKVDPETFSCPPEALEPLLNERTRIVALPHASNIAGQVEDVRAACEMAHRVGARVVADGVAYAPHAVVDVRTLGVDWYVLSAYKVYGPHMAILFGRNEAFAEVEGPNHFFIAPDAIPAKFELGGVSHEACAGLLALRPYLGFLAGEEYAGRATVEKAFAAMAELEEGPRKMLADWLRGRDDLRRVGFGESTASFVPRRKRPREVVEAVHREAVGIRYGHMYAYRLLKALDIDPEEGVVRISLVHYNTEAEVARLQYALDKALAVS